MNNGTSLSFLVYVIYNESIWKCKGEESGYMEKTMEKIRTMMKWCSIRKAIPGQKLQIHRPCNDTCDCSCATVSDKAGICRGKIYPKPERV